MATAGENSPYAYWIKNFHPEGTLERLRLHAVNCREAQVNFEFHRTPMGLAAKIVAEEKLDALLKELKP